MGIRKKKERRNSGNIAFEGDSSWSLLCPETVVPYLTCGSLSYSEFNLKITLSAIVRVGQRENTAHTQIPASSGMVLCCDTPDGTMAGWSEVHPTFLSKNTLFFSPPKGAFKHCEGGGNK